MNKKVKILLIEDDPFLLSMYSSKFETEDFEVIVAENGVEGLRKAHSENPNVILLDIILPEMHGFDVLKKIKEDRVIKKIPVILLTNLNQKDEIEKGMSLGAADYLVKAHFMPSEVIDKIKKILYL